MEITPRPDIFFMEKALQEANYAFEEGEIPVGAVVVCQNRIIGRGYNQVEKLKDVTAHAEMLAITAASNFIGSKYLEDCILFVTLEPCVMCAAAIAACHIPEVVFGASDPKKGFTLYTPSVIHPKITIRKSIKEEDCTELLNLFFQNKRKLNKNLR
jgi:tRNA(adenine34) deaminase